MKEKGFRNGFACLFYGLPGTGKTETVYQLARKTGRNIMVVDVPQLKSMWVGQSEKNVKALFDRYREQVKRAKLTPILLFNEADAIIGKRSHSGSPSPSFAPGSSDNSLAAGNCPVPPPVAEYPWGRTAASPSVCWHPAYRPVSPL